MAEELKPAEIFERAAAEGRRRIDQGPLELTATGFIAGFTIVFGIIAQGTVEGILRPAAGETASIAGALAFGVGVVFLIVGRAELFTENFFDPIAAAFEPGADGLARKIARLWFFTFLLNLVGGAVLVGVLAIPGALPHGAMEALRHIAEDVAGRPWHATFARAIIGGALVAMLSFLVAASRGTLSRIVLAYAVGVLLALGPFDHVVVSLLHVGLGMAIGAQVGAVHAAEVGAIAIAGNLVGGVGLVTLSHVAQAKSEERS